MTEETGFIRPLCVFRDDVNWIIATDPEDAALALAEHLGEPDADCGPFVPLAADSTVSIMCEDGKPSDSGAYALRTCAEWIALMGRGFLASTEW